MTEPWERQPGETEAAYRAFTAYRDLGPDRSLLAAYRQRYGSTAANTPGYFSAWSVDNRWVERAHEYDAYIERKAREEREAVWAARAAEQADRTWTLAQQLRTKAEEMVRFPLTRQRTEDSGRTVIIEPARWRLADARAIAETADKLERLATGEPNERSEVSGPGGTPLLGGLDLTALEDDEKQALLTLLRKARDANARGG